MKQCQWLIVGVRFGSACQGLICKVYYSRKFLFFLTSGISRWKYLDPGSNWVKLSVTRSKCDMPLFLLNYFQMADLSTEMRLSLLEIQVLSNGGGMDQVVNMLVCIHNTHVSSQKARVRFPMSLTHIGLYGQLFLPACLSNLKKHSDKSSCRTRVVLPTAKPSANLVWNVLPP